ncbi:MAG: hypothetical protein IJR26_01770 [Bacteroidales bacterium]|nr:hypothetical protein [Bacteroidales bacterium]
MSFRKLFVFFILNLRLKVSRPKRILAEKPEVHVPLRQDLARRSNCATHVAQLPWRHNICLMEKIKEPNRRLAYAMTAI